MSMALGMASLGTQCANKALGMASLGLVCGLTTGVLYVHSSAHAQAVDQIGISQVHALTIDTALHAHVADPLTFVYELSVENTVHGHISTIVDLETGYNLNVDSSVHAHAADILALTQVHSLGIDNTLHGHFINEPFVYDDTNVRDEPWFIDVAYEPRTVKVKG